MNNVSYKLSLCTAFLITCFVTATVHADTPAPTPKKTTVKKAQPKFKMPKQLSKMPKRVSKPVVNEKPLPPVTGKDGLIAKVNGKGVALSLFKEKYERFTQTFKARNRPVPSRIDSRYRDSIVKRLVEESLISQEAARTNVKVDPKLLTEEFDKYKAMFKTDERFQSYLKNARLTEGKVKDNLSKNLILRVLLEQLSGAQVTDNEVKKYYDENQAKYKVRASCGTSM